MLKNYSDTKTPSRKIDSNFEGVVVETRLWSLILKLERGAGVPCSPLLEFERAAQVAILAGLLLLLDLFDGLWS